MKNALLGLLVLLTISFQTSAQSALITPLNSSYATSAPPQTNVYYAVANTCTTAPETCTYTWSVTNGVIVTPSTGVNIITVAVKWNNSPSNGTISVSISGCSPASLYKPLKYSDVIIV